MGVELLGSELPIVAAPMAGGASTTALATAVAGSGGFPFLAGGYRSVATLDEQVSAVASTRKPFGVNLFVPGPDDVDRAGFARYAAELADEAAHYGLTLDPTPHHDDDGWPDKLARLRERPVPVVSFTFGLPDAREITGLRRAGSTVLVSVTTREEARAAEDAGADGLVVQGPAAGGHSAGWDPRRPVVDASTVDVVTAIRTATGLPVLAAGGVTGTGSVRELLTAGATAVVVGTLLLRTDESGASATHRDALPTGTGTTVTRAFTGRPARALRNGFVDRHDAGAITGYPAVHHLTRELRRRAAEAGDADRLHLWAGTGHRSAPTGPAAAVIRRLAQGL